MIYTLAAICLLCFYTTISTNTVSLAHTVSVHVVISNTRLHGVKGEEIGYGFRMLVVHVGRTCVTRKGLAGRCAPTVLCQFHVVVICNTDKEIPLNGGGGLIDFDDVSAAVDGFWSGCRGLSLIYRLCHMSDIQSWH